jgi:hypothetical protein
MTCHLSGELVDRPSHVHRARMAQPSFGNSSGTRETWANRHFQRSASERLIKIDRFQISYSRIKSGEYLIDASRQLARGELYSNQKASLSCVFQWKLGDRRPSAFIMVMCQSEKFDLDMILSARSLLAISLAPLQAAPIFGKSSPCSGRVVA